MARRHTGGLEGMLCSSAGKTVIEGDQPESTEGSFRRLGAVHSAT